MINKELLKLILDKSISKDFLCLLGTNKPTIIKFPCNEFYTTITKEGSFYFNQSDVNNLSYHIDRVNHPLLRNINIIEIGVDE
jgi:hypothetical protein